MTTAIEKLERSHARLLARASELIGGLEQIGFGCVDDAGEVEQVSGADTVDVINENFEDLRAAIVDARDAAESDEGAPPTIYDCADDACELIEKLTAALQAGSDIARDVIKNWGRGDLVGAVNRLESWYETDAADALLARQEAGYL